MEEQELKVRRMLSASLLLAFIIGGSSLVYYGLTDGEYSYLDCLFMAVITVSTVGYEEVIPVNTPLLQSVTMVLIITGTGGLLYFASLLTAFIIEGDLNHWLTRRRVKQRIDQLRDHAIICGIGSTGRHAAKELMLSECDVVVVEANEEKVTILEAETGSEILHLIGDAADDEILQQAGIERARAIVCALPNDRDNLFVVVTARKLNPKISIVSRVVEESSAVKIQRAGADKVISPNMIGGQRLAYEVLRPDTTDFLELIMTEEQRIMRIDMINIPEGSSYVGKTLAESDVRKSANTLVIAIRDLKNDETHYAPGPDFRLDHDMDMVVFGDITEIRRLRKDIQPD